MALIENGLKPIIILIGGAAGTSKTSNGNSICNYFGINHRMGSGFMRESAKSFVTREDNPYLYNFSFSPHDDISPFQNLYNQSETLKEPIELCINRAYNEGTSLLIEGVNVIPGLITTKNVSLKCIFTVENYAQHYKMITGKTHFKRQVSEEEFTRVREIQENFKALATRNNWLIFDISEEDNLNKKIEEKLNEKNL